MRNQAVFIQSGKFTDVDTTPQYLGQLGVVVYDYASNAYFQYVLMSATAADAATPTPAANLIARWKDSDSFTVCTHVEAAEGLTNSFAGVLKSALLTGKYGWIQKSGKAPMTCDGTAAVGSLAEDDGTDNGTVTCIAAGTTPNRIPLGVVVSVTSPYSSTAPLVKLRLVR
jgi:hypothetical protein